LPLLSEGWSADPNRPPIPRFVRSKTVDTPRTDGNISATTTTLPSTACVAPGLPLMTLVQVITVNRMAPEDHH
jgi:hypothetical protein